MKTWHYFIKCKEPKQKLLKSKVLSSTVAVRMEVADLCSGKEEVMYKWNPWAWTRRPLPCSVTSTAAINRAQHVTNKNPL